MREITAMQPCQPFTDPSYRRAGIVLIILSCALYAVMLAVPFLPVASNAQVLLATGLLLSSEGTFWFGCLLAGKDVFARLWPWSQRRRASR